MRIRIESEKSSTETTIAKLFAALQSVTRDEDDAVAVFEYMLDENRVRVLAEPALA